MEQPKVVVCSIRPEIVLPLRMAFGDVGVTCVDVRSSDEALMAIAGADTPPAIVVDQCDFDDEVESLLDQVRAYDNDVPVLLLGVDGCSIDNQAAAFEQGGAGYFKLPVDVGKVVAKLSVYLGCALPEIRGAALPGFRVHGTDDLPDPPRLDDVPISGEGEPTSLFDLDRSDIDREALDDSFDGDHVVQRDLGGGSFAAHPPSDRARQTATDDSEEGDVFSSSAASASSSFADSDPHEEVTRPLPQLSAAQDDEPQEAADIRERVARLRRSRHANRDEDEHPEDAPASDLAQPTTQLGDATLLPLATDAPADDVDNDTGDFLSLHSDDAINHPRPSAEGTQVVSADETAVSDSDDDIGSALDDMAAPQSGSAPLPETMFDQEVTRPPEAEDAISDAVNEAHRGADPYAHDQLDDDGMMSALDEAQASVERYALERTQDGDPIDDEKTPESGEAAPLEEVLEHARMLAEEEARAAVERRIEEAQERLTDAEDEDERLVRLEAERQRIEDEAKKAADEEFAAKLAEQKRTLERQREEERQQREEEREAQAAKKAAEEAAELDRVREEAIKDALADADARLEEERAKLFAEIEAERVAQEEERERERQQEVQRLAALDEEKARLVEEARQKAEAELEAKIAAERERLEREREEAKAKADALAKEREELDQQARAAFDDEKARLAAEIEAQAAEQLQAQLEDERAKAQTIEEEERQRFLAEQRAEQERQAQQEAEERERIANEVGAEEREKMERKLQAAREAFEQEQRDRKEAHEREAKARAEAHATALDAIREEAAAAVRREVEEETAALLAREREAAEAAKKAAEEEHRRREQEWAEQEKAAIARATAEAEHAAREQAETEAARLLEDARKEFAADAKKRSEAEAERLQQARAQLEREQQRAKEEAEQRIRDEVFSSLREQQQAALAAADEKTSAELDALRQAHNAEQERIEREHREALEREREQMLAQFEAQLREEREAKEQLRLAREEDYRRRIEKEAEAMRAAHEEAMRLAAEDAAKKAAERLAAEQEDALREQEEKDRHRKERVAYRAGLFGGEAPDHVSDTDLDAVGSEQWVEGRLALAAQGGAAFPDAGAAPLSPPDVPLNYVAMEPASGTFADGELGAALYSAHFLDVTGALTITHADGRERTLYFEEGSPVAIESELPADRAEEHLLRAGLLTTARYEELRAGPALSARRLCALLVTEGSLAADELFAAVRGVLTEQVLSVLEWERGTYAFKEERCHPGDRVRLSSPFDHVIAEGLRRKFDEPRLWRVLGGPSTILAPDDRAPRLPPLGPQEKRALALFDGARALEDVVLESGATALVALRAGLVAISCGAAKVVARGLGAGTLGRTEAADDEEAAGQVELDRARIADRKHLARHGDYFAFLGVTERATAYEVRQAADRLRRRFDPARYSAPAYADLRRSLEEIREVIDEAEGVLGDDDLRASYRLHHVQ